jgi:serine/threonine protein kinase
VDFLVMEYLEGETLARRLKKGPLPLAEALLYGAQIAQALAQAHRRGVVHRDLKPANIMLTKAGVKLLDFGLARVHEPAVADGATQTMSMTGEGVIAGTPQYMSPEQVQAWPVDARSDIFAFATVLYEMITAGRAFTGDTTPGLMAAILRDAPPEIETAPPELKRLLKACWAKDPDERWQSAADLAHELEWIAGSLSAAPEPTRGMRRREMLAWSASAVCGAAAGASTVRALRPGQTPLGRFQFTIGPPPGFNFQLFQSPPAISPDGRALAFAAVGDQGVSSR